MANSRHQAPPSDGGGMAARIAAELREARGELDEFSIARMERAMIQQWRARAARVEPLAGSRRRWFGRELLFGAALLGATVFGTLLGIYVLSDEERQVTGLASEAAQFEMRLADGAVQRGLVSEGQTLESGRHGHVQVDIGRSRVEVAPQSMVRFDRIEARALQLTVIEGRIEAQFNPDHGQGRSMVIETRAARVLVVGTRFSVAVDGRGNTTVEVTEGAVEVVPRRGGRRRSLAAGQRTEVVYDIGGATEQAVNDVLSAPAPLQERADVSLELYSGESEVFFAQPGTGRAPELEAMHPPPLSAATTPFYPVMSSERRLEQAREWIQKGRHRAARRRLRGLSRDSSVSRPVRAEALVLMAESYKAQGYVPRASDAYRAAAAMAPQHPTGHGAVFALAQLLENQAQDPGGAQAAYLQYLRRAPRGAQVVAAREALCRLGAADHCR